MRCAFIRGAGVWLGASLRARSARPQVRGVVSESVWKLRVFRRLSARRNGCNQQVSSCKRGRARHWGRKSHRKSFPAVGATVGCAGDASPTEAHSRFPANERPLAACSCRGSVHNLVDPASSHMLVSKIKPCMSQYKLFNCKTANGSLKQLSFP